MTIQRLESASTRFNEWVRAASRTVNAVLMRVDGNFASVSGDYTVNDFDGFVGVDTASAVTVTLPGNLPKGHRITVKDTTGNAMLNNITISGTIDGSASVTIVVNYGVRTFLSNGQGQWWEC